MNKRVWANWAIARVSDEKSDKIPPAYILKIPDPGIDLKHVAEWFEWREPEAIILPVMESPHDLSVAAYNTWSFLSRGAFADPDIWLWHCGSKRRERIDFFEFCQSMEYVPLFPRSVVDESGRELKTYALINEVRHIMDPTCRVGRVNSLAESEEQAVSNIKVDSWELLL